MLDKLKASDGKEYGLEDFLGSNLVLFFYPKDNTPGWTTEAQEFTGLRPQFEALGARVVGISRQGVKSHLNFIEKKDLDLLLLSDPDEIWHKHFEVIKEKKLYGKTVLGVERSSFIFNKEGELIHEARGVKAKGHAQEMLELIKSLD